MVAELAGGISRLGEFCVGKVRCCWIEGGDVEGYSGMWCELLVWEECCSDTDVDEGALDVSSGGDGDAFAVGELVCCAEMVGQVH